MKRRSYWILGPTAIALLAALVAPLAAQQSTRSPGEQALDRAAEDGAFAFLLICKTQDAASQAMSKALQSGLAKRTERTVVVTVLVTDPRETAIVERFGVSRAPLPMALAVAPNGAITGVFHQQITPQAIDKALVTPTMTRCMKSLQDGKLVLVCVKSSERTATPKAVADFGTDEHFRDRVRFESFVVTDPAERKFLDEMELDPASVTSATTILLAPPGVLVGKFAADTSMDTIAAELAKAGKCCDDPNCKHHSTTGAAPKSTAKNEPAPNSKRRK